LNNVFILTLDTRNAQYQSKIKTYNDFFPGIMQLRGADFYFMKNGSKIDHAAPFE
jgi:hypothetical protein